MEKNQNLDFTICSVYHSPETYKLLELNFDFTKKINPEANFLWIASDGADPGVQVPFDSIKFNQIKGANITDLNEILPDPKAEKFKNSYLHAASLNRTLPYIETRFALFLDNDFYITRPGWISEAINYMQKKNLAFFGSPFYPMRYQKFRYFPHAQCMFIDFAKIKKETVDFRGQHFNKAMNHDTAGIFFRNRIIQKLLGNRLRIGQSRDTSYALFYRYANDPDIKYESVVPVINFNGEAQYDFVAPREVFSFVNRFLEKFLPERFSYIPKIAGSYSFSGFAEFDLYDVRGAAGWEEYLWQGEPFGFHMQATAKRFRRGRADEEEISANLKAILESFN